MTKKLLSMLLGLTLAVTVCSHIPFLIHRQSK